MAAVVYLLKDRQPPNKRDQVYRADAFWTSAWGTPFYDG